MSLRLSVNRCGFDMDTGELRDAIADLTRLAGEMGAALTLLSGNNAAPANDVQARAAALRGHRDWLIAQAALLQAKLRQHEARARNAVMVEVVTSMRVSLAAMGADVSQAAAAKAGAAQVGAAQAGPIGEGW